MSEDGREIAYCHSCGDAMEVTEVAPFSNVGCPKCGKHTRVKREFGPYTLVRTHAIGGMSVVFAAHDNTLEREVALKILNEDFSADEKRIAAFEEEARLTASISHPHVVRLLTTGRAFNRYYIAMEFVTGGHLERRIRDKGSLSERDVLALALQVADGLRAAHDAGLIHRDVKPGNILLDGEGNAKIVDFGLALVTHGGRATADEIWATPYYVPPEAIEGRSEDFRSDLYAFGATLYHALAGKPPCSEESMATAKLREAKKRVVPLDQAAPWLGIETCALIDRAMAYDPGGRFRSYGEVIDALQSALRNAKTGAGPKPPPTTATHIRQLRRTKSRRVFERLGTTVGILAVIGAIGFGIWWVTQPDDDPNGAGNGTNGGKVEGNGGKKKNGKGKNGGGDLAAQNRVGKKYTSARSSLEQGDYPAAEATFADILDDKGAPEPTATLAGVESAIAALLDGRSQDARERAAAVTQHVTDLDPTSDPACRVLGAAAGRVADLAPDDPDALPPGTPAEVTAALLLGLKNWEQGCHKQAAGWFEQVAKSKVGGNEWASGYRQLATNYLADHEVLLATDYDQLPDSIEGCEALKSKLDDGLKQLKTRGRATFNLRQRQLQIARHARHLAKLAAANQPDPDEPATLADELPTIKALIGKAQFADAAERLKAVKLSDDGDLAQRKAWLYMAEASATFLADLASDMEQGMSGVQFSSSDGSASYDRVAGVGETGPQLAAGENGAVEVPWGAIQPAQLIAVHQLVVRSESNPLEQARRHEQAVAYQYLVGDREGAKIAAGRLAESSPAFRQRWSEAMKTLQL